MPKMVWKLLKEPLQFKKIKYLSVRLLSIMAQNVIWTPTRLLLKMVISLVFLELGCLELPKSLKGLFQLLIFNMVYLLAQTIGFLMNLNSLFLLHQLKRVMMYGLEITEVINTQDTILILIRTKIRKISLISVSKSLANMMFQQSSIK